MEEEKIVNEESEIVQSETPQSEVIEPVQPEPVQPTVQPEVPNKKNKFDNKKNIIIAAVAALVLLLGLYVGYAKVYSPKTVFKTAINKGYSKVEKLFEDSNVTKKTLMTTEDMTIKMTVDDSLKDADTTKTIEKLNNFRVKTVSKVDPKNNKATTLINVLSGSEELLNVNAYINDQKLYVKIKDTIDKYIEFPLEINSNSKELTKDEMKYLLSKTKDLIINNMNEKDFTEKTEKIKIDKKEIKVKKVLYNISEKSTSELTLKVLKEAKKDEKYIKLVAKVNGKSVKETKKSIDEAIKNVEKKIKSGKLSNKIEERFGVVVKGFFKNYAGFIFESDEAKIVYYTSKGDKAFIMSEGKEEVVKMTIYKNKYFFEIGEGKEKVELEATKVEKNKVATYDYTLSSGAASLDGKLVVDKSKVDKDGTGKTVIKLNASMMGLIKFEIKNTSEVKEIKKVEDIDVSNSIKNEDLSMEDTMKIMLKIFNIFEF